MKAIIVLSVILLFACDTPAKPYKCTRDTASLQSLDDCLEHPQCKLTGDEFHIAKQLRRNVIRYCGLNPND